MRNFTWNRFPIKNLLIDSLLTPIVESTYLSKSKLCYCLKRDLVSGCVVGGRTYGACVSESGITGPANSSRLRSCDRFTAESGQVYWIDRAAMWQQFLSTLSSRLAAVPTVSANRRYALGQARLTTKAHQFRVQASADPATLSATSMHPLCPEPFIVLIVVTMLFEAPRSTSTVASWSTVLNTNGVGA